MKQSSKETLNKGASIASIRLKGEPYRQNIGKETIDCTDTLESLAHNTRYEKRLKQEILKSEYFLQPLYEGGYYGIDAKIKSGYPLSFKEAFSLIAFVAMGTNNAIHKELSSKVKIGDTSQETVMYQAISLLTSMSTKESFYGLTANEIAGLTAATLQLDTIVRINSNQPTFGMGGMGGDHGYPRKGNNSKLFSLSTMGAAVLANFGTTHKHHSYPNTSKIAGQTAVESLGARSDQNTKEQFEFLQNETNLLMSSCHTTRTIHTLSHRLKGETINHVIGPLSIPVSFDTELHALIGTNHNVHPETIIKSLQVLEQHQIQRYRNSVAFSGILGKKMPSVLLSDQEYYQNPEIKKIVVIDEVAPPPNITLASFLVNGKNKGTFYITPEDFLGSDYSNSVNFGKLLIPNTAKDILKANHDAITGSDFAKSIYLSMTVALALFTKDYAHLPNALDVKSHRINSDMLQECLITAHDCITSGHAKEKLNKYIQATQTSVGL